MQIQMRLACASLLTLIFTLLAGQVRASESAIVPLTANCLNTVAEAYQIHPDVLLAILIVEGGTVGRNSASNQNGSYDIGPFQINTIHRSVLAEMGITESELRNNGCTNAAVAAWQLRRVITPEQEASITNPDEYLRAIARYHSATPEFNAIYARKLAKAFEYIYAQEGHTTNE